MTQIDQVLNMFMTKAEVSIKFDIVKSGWPIRYFKGLQGIVSKNGCISYSEN